MTPLRLLPAPYRALLALRPVRRLLLALLASDLGDGMSAVAVAWLAVRLAPEGRAGTLVGLAVAAYALPGVLGALLFGRRLRRLPPAALLRADALTRACFLAAVPLALLCGLLRPAVYVGLLAGSSVLHAWGGGAKYALLGSLVPEARRAAANALLSTSTWVSTIAGPALAGLLTAFTDPALILGLDALTFALLALRVGTVDAPGVRVAGEPGPAPGSVRGVLRTQPVLLGLLLLTWGFNFLYGPVEVALPLFVHDVANAGGGLLGLYWSLFGCGAVLGTLTVGALRVLPVRGVVLGIVAGHGVALLTFWPPAPSAVPLIGFAVAGAVYGPYSALSYTLFQELTPAALLTSVLALRGAVLLTAAPLGAALGGPLSGALGARAALAATGAGMVALAGAAVATVLLRSAPGVRRARRPHPSGRGHRAGRRAR